MKRIVLILAFAMATIGVNAQIDANSLMGLPTATAAEISGLTGMSVGQCVFNTDDNTIWWYDGSVWARATDDQNITGITLNGSNILQVDIEGGTGATADLSALDQDATNVPITDSGSNFTATNVEGALAELAAVSGDNLYSVDGSLTSNRAVTQGSFDLNFDANTLVIDGSANRVGVGTNTPQSALQIANNVGSGSSFDVFSDYQILLHEEATSENSYGIGLESGTFALNSGFQYDFKVGGVGEMNLTDSRLDVEGNIELGDRLIMNDKIALMGDDNWLRLNQSSEFTNGVFTPSPFRVDNRVTVNEAGGNHDFRVEGDTQTHLLFTDASADQVGIGTDTPDARLDVEGGTVRFSDYGDNGVTGTGTSLLSVEADGDVVEVNSLDASRVFYPPSIAIDVSTNGTGLSINLYTQYTAQYATPNVASTGAPATIPTYAANELYYYVTYFDPAVFANISIDANGVMTYDIIGQPADYNSLINVVFVVQ